jgi:hypothetical protein
VHLSFANIARAVANFEASGAVWLIATEWQSNADCEDGDWRALNFERAPFNWGPPVELLNEHCREAGSGWRDKSLGVWRLAQRRPGERRDPYAEDSRLGAGVEAFCKQSAPGAMGSRGDDGGSHRQRD